MKRKIKKLAEIFYAESKDNLNITYEVYEYGFFSTLEILAAVITSMCIAAWFNMMTECIAFIFLFCVLRSYAGGFHFESFSICYIISSMITIGVLLFVKMCNIPLIIIWSLMGIFTTLFYIVEPISNAAKTINTEENVYFKKKLRYLLFIISALFFVSILVKQYRYASLISVAVTLTFLLMVMGKWKDKWNRGIL